MPLLLVGALGMRPDSDLLGSDSPQMRELDAVNPVSNRLLKILPRTIRQEPGVSTADVQQKAACELSQ